MPTTPQSFIIDPQDVTLAIDVTTASGGAAVAYSTRDGSTPMSLPITINTPTEFFFTSGSSSRELSGTPYVVSAKFGTVEVAGPGSTTAIVEAHNWQPATYPIDLGNGSIELANLLGSAGGGGGSNLPDPVTIGHGGTGALTASAARTALGLAIGTDVEAYDADLAAIAALDSGTAGALATDGSGWIRKTYAQLKTSLSLVKADIGLGNVDNTSDANKPVSTAQQTALDGKQTLDSDLTTIAGLTATTDNFIVSVASAWASRTPAQVRSTLGLVIGTNVQAWDADLDTLAGLTATTDNFVVSVASAWASRTPAQVRSTLGLVIGTNVQAWDGDLDTIAGLTATTDSFMQAKGSAWAARTIAQVKTDLAISNVDNTSDANKPVSTAQQTALDLKANLASPTFTGTVVLPAQTVTRAMEVNQAANSFRGNNTGSAAAAIDLTVAQAKTLLALVKADVGLGNVDNTADSAKTFNASAITAGTLVAARGGTSVTDITTDWLTQYAILAGRSGGQELIGGTAAANTLTLRGTSASTHGGGTSGGTTGGILTSSRMTLYGADETVTAKTYNGVLRMGNSYTLNFASASFGLTTEGVIDIAPNLIVQQSMAAGGFAPIRVGATVANISSVAANLQLGSSFQARNTFTADTQSITLTAGTDYFSRFTLNCANSGTITASGDYVNFEAAVTLDATNGTVNVSGTYAAFAMLAPTLTNSPTLANVTGFRVAAHSAGSTTSYGIDIGALTAAGSNIGVRIAKPSGGTTNVGLQNSGSTVNVPTVSTLSAASSTIDSSATCTSLNNTSGGPLTLTSAPTVADGVNGQILIIFTTSANAVTIQDQGTLASSNLRLSTSTFVVSARDNITLLYSSTVGDWIEIARTNVI